MSRVTGNAASPTSELLALINGSRCPEFSLTSESESGPALPGKSKQHDFLGIFG
jgi:hypothetical protein